jgi:hypothetical protein
MTRHGAAVFTAPEAIDIVLGAGPFVLAAYSAGSGSKVTILDRQARALSTVTFDGATVKSLRAAADGTPRAALHVCGLIPPPSAGVIDLPDGTYSAHSEPPRMRSFTPPPQRVRRMPDGVRIAFAGRNPDLAPGTPVILSPYGDASAVRDFGVCGAICAFVERGGTYAVAHLSCLAARGAGDPLCLEAQAKAVGELCGVARYIHERTGVPLALWVRGPVGDALAGLISQHPDLVAAVARWPARSEGARAASDRCVVYRKAAGGPAALVERLEIPRPGVASSEALTTAAGAGLAALADAIGAYP